VRGGEGRGGISNRGCRLGNSPSTSFFFLCSEVAAGDQVIEVHCCCCPGGLLGGLAAGREGFWREFLRGIVGPVVVPFCLLALPSHRGRRRRSGDRGPSLLLSGWTPRWPRCGAGTVGRNFREREREFLGLVVLHFFPLFAFASRSPQAPEVHYCCCLGGLLGGLVAGRGGFGGPFLIESCFCSLPFVCSLWLSWVMRLLPSLLVGGWLPTPGRPRCNVTRWGDPFFRFVDLASIVHCV